LEKGRGGKFSLERNRLSCLRRDEKISKRRSSPGRRDPERRRRGWGPSSKKRLLLLQKEKGPTAPVRVNGTFNRENRRGRGSPKSSSLPKRDIDRAASRQGKKNQIWRGGRSVSGDLRGRFPSPISGDKEAGDSGKKRWGYANPLM